MNTVFVCDIAHINKIVDSETRLDKKEWLILFYHKQLRKANYDGRTLDTFIERQRSIVVKEGCEEALALYKRLYRLTKNHRVACFIRSLPSRTVE